MSHPKNVLVAKVDHVQLHTYWSAVKLDGFGVHVSLQNGSVRIC